MTAGDPDLATSAEILKALDRAGADVIEVGVPFSDPLADGPVIQRATERALAAGSNLRESLALVERIRPAVSAPLVMFSYANPILRMGVDAFARRAAAAGVDGVLALDLPIEEAGEFRETLAAAGARYDIPVESDDHRRAHPDGWGAGAGIPLRDFTAWRDRGAGSGRGGRRSAGPADSRAHDAADRARLRHLAARTCRRGRRVCRRRGRRQRAGVAHRRVAGHAGARRHESRNTFDR